MKFGDYSSHYTSVKNCPLSSLHINCAPHLQCSSLAHSQVEFGCESRRKKVRLSVTQEFSCYSSVLLQIASSDKDTIINSMGS